MMRIPCPWCGERAESEFTSGGEAFVPPDGADGASQACLAGDAPGPRAFAPDTWAERLYGRDNRYDAVTEWWWHAHGCRQWLVAERDPVSHRWLRVRPAIEAPGSGDGS